MFEESSAGCFLEFKVEELLFVGGSCINVKVVIWVEIFSLRSSFLIVRFRDISYEIGL